MDAHAAHAGGGQRLRPRPPAPESEGETIAEVGGRIVGFIAVEGEWIEQLYLDPAWTGRGIGSRLLALATANMPVSRLHCFQANDGARRFYERHGFRAEAFGDGFGNEEGLPDITYVRRGT
ncbi:GNAT family N-acetyltransferase [Neoaquamicrobium sediminum]|uniref:GNAT family N-acetyltransferase n=1 Tax=Neoaquamicrobium sediminum TaxID=1849104 RepID=UPI001FD2FFCC|nr:GNAT family N-acetyltransferase [Mesorhizobium sediminum]